MRCALVLIAMLTTACTGGSPKSSSSLTWLAGCWTNGSTVERWIAAEGGYLFGSGVLLADGAVKFFEQMRIEPGDEGPVFSAYPSGHGPTVFKSDGQAGQSIAFINASHDYPQRIHYHREGSRLTATPSLIDGSKASQWDYRRCR